MIQPLVIEEEKVAIATNMRSNYEFNKELLNEFSEGRYSSAMLNLKRTIVIKEPKCMIRMMIIKSPNNLRIT